MSKRKLLLADDSITIQKVVNLTFADEGIEVISVGDGDSAMQKFDEFMPDMVMADVNMPGLTGYEICQIIKQNDDTRHIPVILLVGSFEPFDEAEANRVGADDFLTKPFQSIRQLVNKVNDLLNRSEKVAEEPLTPEEVAVPPVDTFADTLEFGSKGETPTEYGDSGMDDEMIETSPANDFVAEPIFDSPAETTIDYAKTQPLSVEDLKGFSIVSHDAASEQEASDEASEIVEEQEFAEEKFADAETTSGITEPETAAQEPIEEEPETSEKPATQADTEKETDSEPNLNYYTPVAEKASETESSEVEILEPETAEVETIESETSETEPSELADESETADLSFTETATEAEPESEVSAEPIAADEPESQNTPETETAAADEAEIKAANASETVLTETSETEETETSETDSEQEETPDSATEDAPALGFDDGDLLELPPLVEETGIRPQARQFISEPEAEISEPEVAETEPEVAETETEATQPQAVAANDPLQSFPPELIEAIAQKVAERISDKAIKDIVREIVPQMTEMIIKKIAEEKLKE